MTRVAAYLSVTWYPRPHPVSPQPSTQGRPPLPHLSSPLAFPASSLATPTLAPPEVSGFCVFFIHVLFYCFILISLAGILVACAELGKTVHMQTVFLPTHDMCITIQYRLIISAQRIKFVFWIVIHVKHVHLHDACM